MSDASDSAAGATATQLRLLNAVFCEDIRHEDNGKDILIGVYSDVMAPSRCPVDLRLSLWIQYHAKQTGDLEVRLRLRFGDASQEPPEARVLVSIAEPGEVTLALRGMPVSIDDSGVLVLEHRLPGEDWAEIARKRVICADPATEAPSAEPGDT